MCFKAYQAAPTAFQDILYVDHVYTHLGLCLCVCLSVCLLTHLTYGASVRPEKAVMYSAGKEGLKICGDLPETTAFKSYATKQKRKNQYANAPINVLPHLPPCGYMTGIRQRITQKRAPSDGISPSGYCACACCESRNCTAACLRGMFTNQSEAIGFSAGRVGIYLFCFPQGWGNYNISW